MDVLAKEVVPVENDSVGAHVAVGVAVWIDGVYQAASGTKGVACSTVVE